MSVVLVYSHAVRAGVTFRSAILLYRAIFIQSKFKRNISNRYFNQFSNLMTVKFFFSIMRIWSFNSKYSFCHVFEQYQNIF